MKNNENIIVKCYKNKLQTPRISSKSPLSFNSTSDFDSKFENKISWIEFSTRKSNAKKERELTPYRDSNQSLKMRIPFNNILEEEIYEID